MNAHKVEQIAEQEATHISRLPPFTLTEDPLVGSSGRARFEAILADRLDRAIRRSEAVSLLVLSADDLAAVNERFGWEIGDEVIREIEARVRSAIRQDDPMTRYAGASFVVLIDSPPDQARKTAEKIRRRAGCEPYHQNRVHLRFSVGIAGFDPVSGQPHSPAALLRRASRSLGTARRRGGGRCVVWVDEGAAGEGGSPPEPPLREALRRVKLVFASRSMESLLERARRVAATDATVLVTGASGAGKEVVARAVHELSPRRDQPFVVADCSAI